MNAKTYLSQVQRYREQIERMEEQIAELRGGFGCGAINYEKDRVQTSPMDSMSAKIGTIVDLENAIRKKVNILNMVNGQIGGLKKNNHITILRLIYFEDNSVFGASRIMRLSYSRARHLHLEALEEFENMYLNFN